MTTEAPNGGFDRERASGPKRPAARVPTRSGRARSTPGWPSR